MMKINLILIILLMMQTKPHLQFDFGKSSFVQNGSEWRVINDGVMGGNSKGNVEMKDDYLIFSGHVSLENNGGFSSYSSPYSEFDLAEAKKIKIRYQLSGQPIAIKLDAHQQYWKPNFKYRLQETEEWQTIEIQLTDFHEEVMGKSTGRKMRVEKLEEIIQIGFIVANKTEGDFHFQVDFITFL